MMEANNKMSLLQINSLKKVYRFGHRALKKISFEINEGEIFVLLGPNGAGKTTTIKSLLGIVNSGGEIFFKGSLLNNKIILENFSFLPEEKNLYENMTVGSLIKEIVSYNKNFDLIKIRDYLNRFDIQNNKTIKKLSNGNKTILFLSIVLSKNAELYILDEPMANLDPLTTKFFLNEFRNFSYEGKSILYSTHILSHAEKISDRIAILREGKIVVCDNIDNLKTLYKAYVYNGDLPDYVSKISVTDTDFLYIIKEEMNEQYLKDFPNMIEEKLGFEDIFEIIAGGNLKNV